MHLKKKFKINNSILVIILIIVGIYISLRIISKKLTPILFNYAENETRRVANIIVSKAVNSSSLKEIDDDFFIITKENDTIKSIDFDPVKLNNFMIKVIDKIQTNLKLLESGEIDKIDVDNKELLKYDKKNSKKSSKRRRLIE